MRHEWESEESWTEPFPFVSGPNPWAPKFDTPATTLGDAGRDASALGERNGRLSVGAPAKGRRRRPDSETTIVEQKPVENALLLEAPGPFSLRLEDEDANDLQLADDGRLVVMGGDL